MSLDDLKVTLSCYPTSPGDLVLVRLPADATPESMQIVGRGLEAWAIQRQINLTIVNGDIDLQILSADDLARIGLQRIPA